MKTVKSENVVLIVEDEDSVALLLDQIVEKEGYQHKRARNGGEALKLIDKNFPDLVILDIMMPGVNGEEVLLKIKSTPKTKEIPVIICTAINNLNDVEKFFKWGACGYITKPFEPSRVAEKINAVLLPAPNK